jgi:dolichyl-phosphate beta-glucosyltransferase
MSPRTVQQATIGVEVSASMYLSVVIPAYNEEQRLGKTLQVIHAYLRRQPYPAEIIVVDDGSQDATASVVRACDGWVLPISVLRNGQNRGKGFSVRRGFWQARGEYLLFSDADLSTPIEEVEKLFAALSEPCDIAIGSRALTGSRVEVHQPWYREHMGRLFNVFVQALAVPGIHDTQCGFKCFRREAALEICRHMRAERFGFDVEMLYLARRLGYRVREVPVVWRNSPHTRVRVWRDSVSMIGDLLRLRWHDLRTHDEEPTGMAGQARAGFAGELLPDSLAIAEKTERSGRPGNGSYGSAGVKPEGGSV